jgi:hypothetical protein
MIEIRPDPQNPERLILTATVTLFLEKTLLASLGKELEEAITEQAKKDLQSKALRKEIRQLATKKLVAMLEIKGEKE